MYYNNAYYARVGGITNSEVNSLEMELLRMISFSLFVQPQQYERYRGSLYSHLPQMTQSVPVPVPVPAEAHVGRRPVARVRRVRRGGVRRRRWRRGARGRAASVSSASSRLRRARPPKV